MNIGRLSLPLIVLLEALAGAVIWMVVGFMYGFDTQANIWIIGGVASLLVVTGLVGSIRAKSPRGIILSLEALVGVTGAGIILAWTSSVTWGFIGGAVMLNVDLFAMASAMLLTSSIWGMALKVNGDRKGIVFDMLLFSLGLFTSFITFYLASIFL